MASDCPSPQFPSLRLGLTAPQPSRRHRAQSLLGPSFHDSRMPHVSRIPSRASRASLPPRGWATTCCRLSLRPCIASLSCSLQPLLKLSLLSLGPSLLQFVSIVSLLLIHGNSIFESMCVFHPFPLLLLLFWLKYTSALSPCSQFCRYHHSDSTVTFTLV